MFTHTSPKVSKPQPNPTSTNPNPANQPLTPNTNTNFNPTPNPNTQYPKPNPTPTPQPPPPTPRLKNNRFDVIGGGIYFLSVVSLLPRCDAGRAMLVRCLGVGVGRGGGRGEGEWGGGGARRFGVGVAWAVVSRRPHRFVRTQLPTPLPPPPTTNQPPKPPQDAPTLAAGLKAFAAAFLLAWSDLLLNTYLSLATAVLFFFVCLGFARGGGVGAAPGEREAAPSWQGDRGQRGGGKRKSGVVGPIAKLKTGGLTTQVGGWGGGGLLLAEVPRWLGFGAAVGCGLGG